ncbi:MAG: hypothetical protein AAFW47_04060 [Pseudomonadota bacterium]
MSVSLENVPIEEKRPLIVCDIDEVVLHFVRPFEDYLAERNAHLDKSSFKLGGNIIDRITNTRLDSKDAHALVQAFHADCVDRQPVIEGAMEALDALREAFQVVFLTNVAEDLAARRQAHLASLGLTQPVIQNDGSKAETVRALSARADHVTVFIDDLPPHHLMVKTAAPHIHCVHYMADETFRRLAYIPSNVGEKMDDWRGITRACMAKLD